MKGSMVLLAALLLFGTLNQSYAGGRVKVVTTTLEMADLVESVGGDRVEVYAIFRGLTDIHFFEPVPSQVMKLKRADMLVVAGLDGDVWVRELIDASRNPRIKFGSVGYVDPSDGIRPLQVPEGRIDGSMGDVHPYGNPHYLYGPENVTIAVNNIYEGLTRLSPGDEAYFRGNREAYVEEVEITYSELREKMAPFEGTGIIEYHRSWDYFCEYFRLDLVAALEPKPGIPPSAKHLSDVARIAKAKDARLMLIEPYYPEKPVRYITEETGIKALRLPIYLGTVREVESYLDLVRYNVIRIVEELTGRGL